MRLLPQIIREVVSEIFHFVSFRRICTIDGQENTKLRQI